ncbi:ABC transporter permease [Empedobacter falsenii]|uniref:Macrolide export ATP-binding/permease protein MacB n=1 Tax=Empedobacter falsenii TaxID=343874 RepID=A0A376GFU8_9FLAO|nr:ABC transporter permease [Empedobacter falsenii]STD58648.1 Macrolide export ATP-binding/permease protein MacB [Empedobacter falsenii]
MLKSWLKIYFRNTIKNKGFTFLTILGLAIGIAGVIFSTLYWKDETSYNKWNPNKDKVFEVLTKIGKTNDTWPTNEATLVNILKNKTDKVEEYCYYFPWYDNYGSNVTINNKKEFIDKTIVTQNTFFKFFPFEFVKGNQSDFEKNKVGIAIEEEEAKRVFGRKNPINQIIQFSDGRSFVIYGVYQLKKNSSILPKYVIAGIDEEIKKNENNWGSYNYGLLLKLKNPEDKQNVTQTINQIYFDNRTAKDAKNNGVSVEQYVKENGKYEASLQSLSEARLSDQVSGFPEGKGNALFLKIILGLSILILILSVINYVNLASAQALKRAKEVGVRKVFGATKNQVIFQFMIETILTTVLAFLCALTVVEVLLPSYNELINKQLELNLISFLPHFILIFIIVVVFSGLFPAIYVANFQVIKVLKGNFSRSKNGIWLRNTMLIIQFTIATFFIVSSFIVTHQMDYMAKKDLGLKGDQIISIAYYRYDLKDGKRYKYYQSFKPDLLKIKGVEAVNTGTFQFGTNSGATSGFDFNGNFVQATNFAFDFGLVDMLKIQLKEGRNLDPNFSSDTIENVLVNETTQKILGKDFKINTTFKWNDRKFKLVGIVKDFNLSGPNDEIPPMLLMNMKTVNWMGENMRSVFVKIDAENASETIAAIEKFWKAKVDQDYPFEYEFVDKQFARSYENYTKQEKMFKILNVIVITIALFGLFALSSYTIERKYKEIAIRKVLGAETSSLLQILSKQYIYFAFIGFALAILPSYFLMQKWLENFAYRIDISIWIYVFAFILLLSLTLIVVLIKAYSATRINSLNYLKYE